MSNPTTPFGWQMPTNTDLVTDLPADFEVFGQAVATSMQDLLGGTTGQVLKKNTNADMDFVWAADAAGMTNPMTTTGDVIYSSPGSTPVRLGIGTANQVLQVNSGANAPEWVTLAAAAAPYAIFQDQKAQNTNGGTFTNGAWRTRDLNTSVANTITSASLASNQITLPAGTFRITAYAQAEQVNQHQLRFYNITDSSEAIAGLPQMTETAGYGANTAILVGNIVITASKVFELQHQCNVTFANTIARGRAGNFTGERYGTVIVEKVA